jgi:hypothetical protein
MDDTGSSRDISCAREAVEAAIDERSDQSCNPRLLRAVGRQINAILFDAISEHPSIDLAVASGAFLVETLERLDILCERFRLEESEGPVS